ncbi:MAG: ribonuclease E/G, partial [Gammaproteobacteria bacterium]
EGQIESAFSREVKLPSGGSLSIDHTEALISIDINSARSTAGVDIEETAASTNLEAADEIARQLRLRDLGGLVVIDFIDMVSNRNQREVEERLKEALKIDRARVQVGRISRFGLLEMSRQRLRPSLGESSHLTCPRCSGRGTIRSVESLALSILRIIEEEAIKDMTGKVVARLPVETASFLLNEKRQVITEIEQRVDVQVVIVPNPDMETPHFQVQRLRLSEAESASGKKASYLLNEENPDEPDAVAAIPAPIQKEVPAVKHVIHNKPLPETKASAATPGFLSRLFAKLLGSSEPEVEAKSPRPEVKPDVVSPRKQEPNRRRRTGNNPEQRGQRGEGAAPRPRRNRKKSGQGSGNTQQNRKNSPRGNNRQRNPNTGNDNKTENTANTQTRDNAGNQSSQA